MTHDCCRARSHFMPRVPGDEAQGIVHKRNQLRAEWTASQEFAHNEPVLPFGVNVHQPDSQPPCDADQLHGPDPTASGRQPRTVRASRHQARSAVPARSR